MDVVVWEMSGGLKKDGGKPIGVGSGVNPSGEPKADALSDEVDASES